MEQAQEIQEGNSEKKYTLQHNRPDCIGCAACEAVAPDFWEMHEDGKSDIKNCKKLDNEWEELDISKKDFELNKEAAETCPVNVIHLIDKKTGEKII
ncbi:ferredoxin [Candidatus Woesearchaeota archaeon]|nr:ferredoxin [Candidatus Woesearchaeota archaeon]